MAMKNADVTKDKYQVMPGPGKSISKNLPLCSVIRPTSTPNAGAVAAFMGFTAMGLFEGQSNAFFNLVASLAADADAAGNDR